MVNRQVFLKSRPTGIPQAENFGIRDGEMPKISDGEYLVKMHYLSADPAMRGWILDSSNYWPQIEIGETMRAFSAGEIVESKHPSLRVGDHVMGIFGWQEYGVGSDKNFMTRIEDKNVSLSLALGVLGLNGLTAYFGLLRVGEPKAGETVIVSTAAGSVGSCVGQIAKIKGCRTIGIAGGADKVRQCIEEFGYDAAIDYKTSSDLDAAIKKEAPEGIDVYYDNTSGAISDAVIRNIRLNGRIIICGTASYPSWNPWNMGPRPERHLLVKRAKMQGMLTTDWKDEFSEAIRDLSTWIKEGRLNYREEVFDGIEHAPGSLQRLYSGENTGKLVIKLPNAA